MTTAQIDRLANLLVDVAIKTPCIAATTAAITLSGQQTVDGVAVVAGDSVLVKDQASGSDNGIYEVDTGTWTRRNDFNGANQVVEGTLIKVNEGSTGQGFWYVTTTGDIIVGTTSLAFAHANAGLASVSTYMQTVLPAATAAVARSTLGAVGTTGNDTIAGQKTLTGAINTGRATVVSSVGTADIFAAAANEINFTGSATVTDFPDAPQAGAERVLYCSAGITFTENANLSLDGGINYQTSANDIMIVTALTTSTFRLRLHRKNGMALVHYRGMQPLTVSQSAGSLTFTFADVTSPTRIDYRSSSLTVGNPTNNTNATQLFLSIPSGATLGAISTVSARILLLQIYTGSALELAVVNLAGGVDLQETGIISTTAITAGSTSNNVVYSNSARSNVVYRVVGFIDAVNTAGAWGNPTLVQSAGGLATPPMGSIGYGQTWQTFTVGVTRVLGTTYYNTTGRPIMLCATFTPGVTPSVVTIAGVALGTFNNGGADCNLSCAWIVPPGASYSITQQCTSWAELR